MAQCAYCEQELPGLEKVCRECFDKLSAQHESQRTFRAADFWKALAAVVIIIAVPSFLESPIHVALSRFYAFVGATALAVKLTLFGVAAGAAIWDAWKWKSWLRLLLWASGAMAAIYFFLWIGDARRAWHILWISGLLAFGAIKGIAKAKNFWQN